MAENNHDVPDLLLGDETAAGRKGSRSGARGGHLFDEGLDQILIGGGKTRNEDDIKVEGPLLKEGGGVMGWIFLAVAIIGFAVGTVYVVSDQDRKDQVREFFTGDIKAYKEADRRAEEAWQRRVNAETRNRYGSVVLEYSPKDARLTIKELTWTESFDEHVQRVLKGGDDKRVGPAEKLIPNKSHELKENEVVESLPLIDLPLMQKTEDEKQVQTFAYELTIEKEGYFPRKFLFVTDDFPGQKTDDQQVMKWQQTGPEIYQVPWSGADLMPRPEMMRPFYVTAMVQFNCYKNAAENKKKTPDELDYEFTVTKRRNKFATDTQWNEVEAALRANAELWPQIETEISEGKCE